MRGLLCSSTASNNEEYKKVIRTRMNRMALIFVIGVITIGVALYAKKINVKVTNGDMFTMYTGLGTGLVFVSIILWIKNKSILSDEKKLKESRIINTDERVQEISNRAFRLAATVLIIALYIVGLIGGLFNPLLVKVFMSMVGIFLVVYLIAYKVLEKRM